MYHAYNFGKMAAYVFNMLPVLFLQTWADSIKLLYLLLRREKPKRMSTGRPQLFHPKQRILTH